MVATGEAVDPAEWIIDDTCLVQYNFALVKYSQIQEESLTKFC